MSRHRPVPSLADLASVAVKALVKIGQTTLENLTMGYVSHYFNSRPADMMRRQAVKTIQDYILCVPYLFQEISYELMTGDAGCLEIVLLPKLRVLEVNQESLSTVLEHRASLEGVTCLLLDCNINKSSLLEPQLLNFIGNLHHLTAVKLSSNCSDQLCAILALSCPHLRFFDAEADQEMSISDHGLRFLCNLPLVSVILNDEGTEYNADKRYTKLTGVGVAQIFAAVKTLSTLLCDPHLMKEAISFLHSLSTNKTFSLTHIYLRAANKEILFRAQALFPALTSLHLVEPARDVGLALGQISQLRSLFYSNFAWTNIDETHRPTFSRLTSLTLRNPKNPIESTQLRQLGEWCEMLETLSLADYNRDYLPSSLTFSQRKSFFPALTSLVLEGDISLNLVTAFLTSVNNLKQLTLLVSSFSIPAEDMDSLLLEVTQAGHLGSLQYLQLYQWGEISLETVLYLIDQAGQLNTIWGLNLLSLSDSDRETIARHIRQNNLNIALHDGVAPEPCRGIQWMRQRVNQREQRLNDFRRATHLEEILIELSLL